MKAPFLIIFLFLIGIKTMSAQNSAIKGGLSVLYSSGSEKSQTGLGGGATFEHKVMKKFSVAMSFDYTGGERTASATLVTGEMINLPYNARTIGIRPELRFYPKVAMFGFFIGAGINMTSAATGEIVNGTNPAEPFIISRSDDFTAYSTLSVGLNLILKPNLCVELSSGLGVALDDAAYYSVPVALRIGYMF